MYFWPARRASRAHSREACGLGVKCFASSSYCEIGMPSTSMAHSCCPTTLYRPQWMNMPNLASCHHAILCAREAAALLCGEDVGAVAARDSGLAMLKA